MSELETSKPWYKKWWGIILTIIFFPILVPYLIWTQTTWNNVIRIAITIVCAFFLVNPFISASANKEKAQEYLNQAETFIAEGKIDEALEAIGHSKVLNSDEDQNKAFVLEEKIRLLNSDDLMKQILVDLSDDDLKLLKTGELKTVFIEHEKLNAMFINKLNNNADKRAEYLAEIEEQKILAQKEAEKKRAAEKKEKIEEQFSAWDGSHINLTRVIKESMNDPKSYKHVETVYWDMGDHLVVRTTFRGTNAFGGVVKNTVKAKVSLDGNVLEIMEQY
jgi:hypothetical protein